MKLRIQGKAAGPASYAIRLLKAVLGIRSCTGALDSTAAVVEAFQMGFNKGLEEGGDTGERRSEDHLLQGQRMVPQD